MTHVMRVQDLIRELEKMPLSAPVMVNVVKYPHEFQVDERWDISQYVESCPLEADETIAERDGIVFLCVELTDFSQERADHLGKI